MNKIILLTLSLFLIAVQAQAQTIAPVHKEQGLQLTVIIDPGTDYVLVDSSCLSG